MATRKNANALTATEKEDLVRAFVMMKVDPVPGRPYNWFDAFALIHRYIQNVNAPAVSGGSSAKTGVNFGHHGAAFAPWHRYFLYRFERQLQVYVPGIMLPYWDWTDPAPNIMVPTFMGPNGVAANNREVRQGYFAANAPGSGDNLVPKPAWWPAGLAGWTLPEAWGTYAGALRRSVGSVAALPPAAAIRQTLDTPSYLNFRANLESGAGVPGTMHNSIHGWFGTNSHMLLALTSASDPMFYLHHVNIDRLWAMWQMDGHGTDYPPNGSVPSHHRLADPMYPWVGAAAGYVANGTLPGVPDLPDYSGEPAVTAADAMDHRALGYSYDTMVTIGISLDRTGSMLGLTPDPMTGMADVSKWEAAKRGVSAFLQDCEAAYQANEAYVVAGVKTFRQTTTKQLVPVFAGTSYGLVKASGGYSAAAFDAAIASQAVATGDKTPMAAALTDAFNTLVQAPFAGAPADERRYLAIFSDGILSSTSGLSTLPDHSLARTAVFAMGFGNAGQVNYATLSSVVAKGAVTFPTPQVFHGENAGQIDKFFSKLLADALGYAPVIDPALELFAGEHVHLPFTATSAEAAFYITAQGADFDGDAWAFQLMSADGMMLYSDGAAPAHDHDNGHGQDMGRMPYVSARCSAGRLTLFVQRNNCGDATWVGDWMLLVARRAVDYEGMVMVGPGPMLFPVAAGPVRGPRYARLLQDPAGRRPARHIAAPASNVLDETINSTNRSHDPCMVVVNIYARTTLRFDLAVDGECTGKPLRIDLVSDSDAVATVTQSAVRAVSPRVDLSALLSDIPCGEEDDSGNDAALFLARIESKEPDKFAPLDEAGMLVSHHGGGWHFHLERTDVQGAYHFGVMISGTYTPSAFAPNNPMREHMHDGAARDEHASDPATTGHQDGTMQPRAEYFSRILTVSTGLSNTA